MTETPQATIADPDKAQTVEQWNNDPCGSTGIGAQEGTPEFFAEVDRVRYHDYAPWLPEVAGFRRFPGRDVLEVGYGMGTDLMQFASGGARVHGIDLTPRHYELATRRFQLSGVDADLRLGDAESLPWPDDSFDVVYSFGVIHHTPDTARCVAEIRRVLKPGGIAIVSVYHRWSAGTAFLLAREAVKGRLFRQSWRRTLSRIETREHSDACPLVKLYSRPQVRDLFHDFDGVRVRCRHFGFELPMVPAVTQALGRLAGWYLVVEARKP